ncbi:MAG: PIN domain-containing protein [Deltaproteobacteria bacterium]|nr:PIN domain-containing protein [Deltaproteobacteria bacterium]
MRALLDVNVLIALLDRDHVHHARARDWFRAHATAHGWASCPITENGCVRIMSQPAYPNPLPTVAVIGRLAEAARHPSHEFWADDCSLLDPGTVHAGRIHGPKQVTDLYLLALAVKQGGCFATFDETIVLPAVPGARKRHLTVV